MNLSGMSSDRSVASTTGSRGREGEGGGVEGDTCGKERGWNVRRIEEHQI